MINSDKQHRIGFVSTRLAGTDGVTLETQKWANILTNHGHKCFYFAGECDTPSELSITVPEAHFNHPDIVALNKDLFDNYTRSSETSGKIQSLRYYLKRRLYEFIQKFGIELLIIENALSIPMNIPLGLALTELIAETSVPTIGHHHDFGWERSRFKISAASDYQLGAFPPILPSIRHVVINSYASRQLALRLGASSTIIPNVMDFDNPPPDPDDYSEDLRENLNISPNDCILLQPTRVVPRKRIELAIELTRRLGNRCTLVISHYSGDEGSSYANYLQTYADMMDVKVIAIADQINHQRGRTPEGKKIYSLADIYQRSNLVTYPSTVEGFGNAFLESIYYRRPIVMSTYEIFRTDIEPKGFDVIEFGDFISEETVKQATEVLSNPEMSEKIIDRNYELGRSYFSYRTLEYRLVALVNESLGFI
ncbi:MAG: glycosyltransferase family 4 protein [Anaerolineales bacterium]|jgi:glycosyltransferase involved in cell wall biosynthesis|nr:glycosyltransferase family 4 protein [Anaerolineales bacterium]